MSAPAEIRVPREPTREMWAAGADAILKCGWCHHDKMVEAVWSAMLGAAHPPPPEVVSGDPAVPFTEAVINVPAGYTIKRQAVP